MALVDVLVLAPLPLWFGWLLEPPFDRYVLPILRAFGKDY